jgi:cell division protein FtsL
MQEISTNPQSPKENRTYFYFSLGFFSLIVFSILSLFLYTKYLNTASLSIRDEIGQIDRKIAAQNADRMILIANILKSNSIRPSVELESLVKKFRDIASENGVRLRGFSVLDDVLSTTVIATTPADTNYPDPISAVFRVMNTSFQGKGFTLEPITSIAWGINERTTWLQFEILPSITQ